MTYLGPFPLAVPVGVLQNSGEVFNILDDDTGGTSTFRIPLSADGQNPPTYYGAYSVLRDTVHLALTGMSVVEFKAYVDQLAVDKGRTPTGSVTAFKNSLLIGAAGQNFFEYIASQGLQRIAPVSSV